MTQHEYLLNKFRDHNNVLSTFDMISDIKLAAEYRRAMCDLRKKGHIVQSFKMTANHWCYRLVEQEPSGQLVTL